MPRVVCWGLDGGSFEWMPTTLKVDLEQSKVAFYNGVESRLINTQDWLEKQSMVGWLILLENYKPMQSGNLEDCLEYLIDSIKCIASRYPGIILYGGERFVDKPLTFSDNFWEEIGYIDNKIIRLKVERQLLEQKKADLEQSIAASKVIPSRILTLATAYDAKPLEGISKAVLSKLSSYYKIEGKTFQISLLKD